MSHLENTHAATPLKPLEWIRLELVPLLDSQVSEKLLYWNPNQGELVGEGAEEVLDWVQQAISSGNLSGSTLSQFEITDPLHKPSELAAILAQYYWVIPQPVEAPGLVNSEVKNTLQ